MTSDLTLCHSFRLNSHGGTNCRDYDKRPIYIPSDQAYEITVERNVLKL